MTTQLLSTDTYLATLFASSPPSPTVHVATDNEELANLLIEAFSLEGRVTDFSSPHTGMYVFQRLPQEQAIPFLAGKPGYVEIDFGPIEGFYFLHSESHHPC